MAAGDNDARCRHACPGRGRRDRDRAGAVCGTGGIRIASRVGARIGRISVMYERPSTLSAIPLTGSAM
jgi:hypothetical protein